MTSHAPHLPSEAERLEHVRSALAAHFAAMPAVELAYAHIDASYVTVHAIVAETNAALLAAIGDAEAKLDAQFGGSLSFELLPVPHRGLGAANLQAFGDEPAYVRAA